MRRVSIRALSALAALGIAGACSLSACSASNASATPPPGGGSGAGSGLGGDTGLFGNGGDMGIGDVTGSGSSTGIGGGGNGCIQDIHQGERLPLDMYFVVDTSGSMNENVTGGTKWSVVSGAMIAFLNDPANADIGTGIGYFPSTNPNAPTTCATDADCKVAAGDFGTCGPMIIPGFCFLCTCSGADACGVSTYAVPSVPLALPPNHGAVVTDIGAHGPGGGTPTRPALEGAMQYVNGWASAHPGRTSIVVLATDGDPTFCTTNSIADVSNIAATALGGPNKIKTFVIGVGSSLTSLNQVAQAGGTNQAYVLDTSADVAKSFSAALAAIHGQAATCDFKVPATTSSGTVNLDTVNVQLTGSDGSSTQVLETADGTPKTCNDPAHPNLWYFNTDKTIITVCPTTCDALKTGGSVQVVLGCNPTQRVPR